MENTILKVKRNEGKNTGGACRNRENAVLECSVANCKIYSFRRNSCAKNGSFEAASGASNAGQAAEGLSPQRPDPRL